MVAMFLVTFLTLVRDGYPPRESLAVTLALAAAAARMIRRGPATTTAAAQAA
jgi:hypothetical protein